MVSKNPIGGSYDPNGGYFDPENPQQIRSDVSRYPRQPGFGNVSQTGIENRTIEHVKKESKEEQGRRILDEMRGLMNSPETKQRRAEMEQKAIEQKRLTEEIKILEEILKIESDANALLGTLTPSVNDKNSGGQSSSNHDDFMKALLSRNVVDEQKEAAQQKLNANRAQIDDAKRRLPEVQQSLVDNTQKYEKLISRHRLSLFSPLVEKEKVFKGCLYEGRSAELDGIETAIRNIVKIAKEERGLHDNFGLKGLGISQPSNLKNQEYKSAMMGLLVLFFCIFSYYATNYILFYLNRS